MDKATETFLIKDYTRAIEQGDIKKVSRYIETRPELFGNPNYDNILANTTHINMMKFAIENGADLLSSLERTTYTLEIVKFLIEQGISIGLNPKDMIRYNNDFSIGWAVMNDKQDILDYFSGFIKKERA